MQAQLGAQATPDKQNRSRHKSLLAGKVFDAGGHRLSPSHARKGGRRYRYYVSQAIMHGGRSTTRGRWSGEALEGFIREAVAARIRDPVAWLADLSQNIVAVHDAAAHLADRVAQADSDALPGLLASAILHDHECELSLDARH